MVKGSGEAGGEALIVGSFEARYERHAAPERTTAELLKEAVLGALADAGIGLGEVDGLGVASFSLKPDHAVDLAWRFGISPRWIMEDPHGGASGLNLLSHAVRAIEAGDAETIVLVAGDHLDRAAFADLVTNYNRATAEHLAPLGYAGPNSLFAMLTATTMRERGLDREDLAQIPVAQRAWAASNPLAVYRDPLTIEDYLATPFLAEPLCRLDCVPVVAGADAIVLRAEPAGGPAARVRALRSLHNPDQQEGDGLVTGFAAFAEDLWSAAGARPEDVEAAYLYDDYPVMVLAQALDLGLVPGGDASRWLRATVGEEGWPLNTSGGQLSAGQAGAAGGMHGIVEAVRQLRGKVEPERATGAELALVAGYGMVLYRHGASHNAAVLERVG
jgi:acetyl-CoA acetyltransferase